MTREYCDGCTRYKHEGECKPLIADGRAANGGFCLVAAFESTHPRPWSDEFERANEILARLVAKVSR